MTRLTAQELAKLEAQADTYPHIGVLEHVARLHEAYAEIDRLNSVASELQRDMNGTLATLEAERRKNAELSWMVSKLERTTVEAL